MLPLCRDAYQYFEPANQNKALGVITPINHLRMNHPFLGEGDPRVGGPWWVTLSKEMWGVRDESSFPKRVEGPWWVFLSTRGGGPWWVIQRGTREKGAPPITAKGRGCALHQTPTGGGALTVPTLNQPYTNVASIKSVKPLIRRWSYTWMMVFVRQSGPYTTHAVRHPNGVNLFRPR